MSNILAASNVVLLVDDHVLNLEILTQILERSGFEVLVATNGLSAIQKLEYVIPDLILLDVMMSEMDGFETCSRLKANPLTCEIPVIFITALNNTEDKIKGLSLGAVDYITKPFYQEEVLARVKLQFQLRGLTKKLEKQNLLLEQRVKERTLDLTIALQELQQIEEKLRYDACHDMLTGLPNRGWLMNRLNSAIALAAQRSDSLYAVLFIDLDRFKIVNDSFGHLVGDALLNSVAQRLQTILHPTDTLMRFGGDEMIILLEEIADINRAISIAEGILKQLQFPFKLKNDYEIFISASIGITLSTMNYSQPEDVLRDADVAMYCAKKAGKGCYAVFNPEMQIKTLANLELENDLRRAIEHQQLCLYYQPIVSLATNRIVGFEALVRWNRPDYGLVNPTIFLPIAEETGLINAIGAWVLQEACCQLSIWLSMFPQTPPLTLNVNLSPVQLRQADLVEQIEKVLCKAKIPKWSLKLEITESCILETNLDVLQKLHQLKALGIGLCIDDFGTGYSCLSRLHELPIDTLKIDRSFVSRISNEEQKIEIIQTIFTLACTLGMSVVAEGVETPLQLKKLRNLGNLSVQGYLFSKPVDKSTATQLLGNPQIFQNIPKELKPESIFT